MPGSGTKISSLSLAPQSQEQGVVMLPFPPDPEAVFSVVNSVAAGAFAPQYRDASGWRALLGHGTGHCHEHAGQGLADRGLDLLTLLVCFGIP